MYSKRLLKIAGSVLVVTLLVITAATFYMMDDALSPKPVSPPAIHCPAFQQHWADSIRANGALRDTFILNKEGLKLHAIYMPAAQSTKRTALLVHGYGCRAHNMLPIAYLYHHCLGMNILLPDLQAHGDSEGDHISMGWKDRFNVLQWIGVADSLFGGNTQMVLHGNSMGAATIMMLSGDSVPSCVKAYVPDCGYTSVWDEFSSVLRQRYSLPPFPLMYTTDWMCRIRYGWGFRQASALAQVSRCTRPMLFIHGGNDTFVPTEMVYRLYEAKPEPRALWISEGSAHDRSYSDHPREYTEQVRAFLTPLLEPSLP